VLLCLVGFLLLDKKKSETLPFKDDFPLSDTTIILSFRLSGFEACASTTMSPNVDEITGTEFDLGSFLGDLSPFSPFFLEEVTYVDRAINSLSKLYDRLLEAESISVLTSSFFASLMESISPKVHVLLDD